MPLTPIEIARLEEHRQAVGTAEVAGEAVKIAGGWMCYEAPGSWSNQAAGLGLEGPVTDEELDTLVAFYESRGAEPKVEVCPFVDETLVHGLAKRGFVLREFENVLARELPPGEDLDAILPRGMPEGLTFVRVDGTDEAQTLLFADVSSSGFREKGAPVDASDLALATRIAVHPRCESYLVRIHGEAAAGGAMEAGEHVGSLFSTSVLPAFRRRGVQAALIAHRLKRARARGCRLVCIHSHPGIPTERNAARLGFAIAYTKVLMVKPKPQTVQA